MVKLIPSIECYTDYNGSSASRVNALCLTLGSLRIYYSYKTPVAFINSEGALVIRENDWGPITGKHLNSIDKDVKKRISGAEFEALLEAHMAKYALIK